MKTPSAKPSESSLLEPLGGSGKSDFVNWVSQDSKRVVAAESGAVAVAALSAADIAGVELLADATREQAAKLRASKPRAVREINHACDSIIELCAALRSGAPVVSELDLDVSPARTAGEAAQPTEASAASEAEDRSAVDEAEREALALREQMRIGSNTLARLAHSHRRLRQRVTELGIDALENRANARAAGEFATEELEQLKADVHETMSENAGLRARLAILEPEHGELVRRTLIAQAALQRATISVVGIAVYEQLNEALRVLALPLKPPLKGFDFADDPSEPERSADLAAARKVA